MSNAACWLGRVRVAGGNLPSRVASDRVVNTLEHLRLVSSCQKPHDNIALHLALAAEILLIPCKTPALDRRVCKQRLQSDLRTRIPAPSSRRKLRSKFRVGVEVGLPVLCIVPQAQPRGAFHGNDSFWSEWRIFGMEVQASVRASPFRTANYPFHIAPSFGENLRLRNHSLFTHHQIWPYQSRPGCILRRISVPL